MAVRVYTKHGLRAHYMAVTPGVAFTLAGPRRVRTFCGKDTVPLATRSRLFRRRLAQASVCKECDEAQNLADAAR